MKICLSEFTYEAFKDLLSENFKNDEFIELQKGNIDNAQQMILEMNKNTVFYEIALVLNAEIEDHLNKDYKKAIKYYSKIIDTLDDNSCLLYTSDAADE